MIGIHTEPDTMESLILQGMKAKTRTEKDIINLKKIALSIKPYSRWWRWGYKGSINRAIRALEKMADAEREKGAET